jgi:large subunit ribosomal protein L33
MAKKKGIRPVITLECTECKERNYTTEKNRRNDPGRMELKKYCPRCKAHTEHREVK